MEPNTIFLTFSFVFGAVVGSFLNVCIYRLPREKSLAFPPSHCTSCSKPIPFYHNIPIISYLILRGRCYNCKEKYSWDYLFVELLAGILSLLLYLKYGPSIHFIFLFAFVMALIVITYIDLEHMIIPNVITYPGVIIGFVYSGLSTDYDTLKFLMENLQYNFLYVLFIFDEVKIFSSILGAIIGSGSLLLIGLTKSMIYWDVRCLLCTTEHNDRAAFGHNRFPQNSRILGIDMFPLCVDKIETFRHLGFTCRSNRHISGKLSPRNISQ